MAPRIRHLLAVVLFLPAAAILAQQQPTFRTGVDVVNVDVSVSRGGEHVGGLQAANFEVYDNGVKQKIDRFSIEEVPLETYLCFDVSGSIEGAKLQQLERAANAFLQGLTRRDKIALVTFAREVDVKQPLTGDFEAFRRALGEIKAGGSTALYDATLKTVNLREKNDSRAVIVVLTDQQDNASVTTQKQAIEAAERSDVIAYGVLADEQSAPTGGMMGGGMGGTGSMGAGFRPPQMQFMIGFLRSLAEGTGGRVFRSNTRLPLEDVFDLVLEDARARYVLSYRPDKITPGWHKLQVKLVEAKGDVVARRGYFVK
jgi:Ca-activated chloride channel homolog